VTVAFFKRLDFRLNNDDFVIRCGKILATVLFLGSAAVWGSLFCHVNDMMQFVTPIKIIGRSKAHLNPGTLGGTFDSWPFSFFLQNGSRPSSSGICLIS